LQNSKTIQELEKRAERSADVTVRLCSSTTQGFTFNVYNENEKIKYIGNISENHIHDDCTCPSFFHGNSENYTKTNPLPFTCKHILKAHSMMEGFW